MITDVLLIVICAYTFSEILTQDGMILHGLFRYMAEQPIPDWLYKPLIGCSTCVAGQWAFWFYLVKYYLSYCVIDHIAFTFTAIFGAYFLALTVEKLYYE